MTEGPRPVLARYPALVQPIAPPEPLGNAGGLSGARLWRFPSGRGRLVLRAWPEHGPDRPSLERLHGWLAEPRALGFTPVPIPDREGQTLQEHEGRFWDVSAWLSGEPDHNRPPSRGHLRGGFEALAALHQSLSHHQQVGPSPGLARRVAEIESLLRGGLEYYNDILFHHRSDPLCQPARHWLRLAKRMAPEVLAAIRQPARVAIPLQPCLRDARGEHLLFEGDRLTGLIDFGAMDIETVAADLARLLSDWVGPGRDARAQALDAYTRIRPLDAVETALIDAFERSAALLGAGLWVRWHFVERRVFDDPNAITQGLHRTLDHLDDLASGRISVV